jgi:hypothetical protein
LVRFQSSTRRSIGRRIVGRQRGCAREGELGPLGIAQVFVVERAELEHDFGERGLVVGQARELHQGLGRLVVLAFVPEQIGERAQGFGARGSCCSAA